MPSSGCSRTGSRRSSTSRPTAARRTTAFAVELRFEEQAAVNYVRAGSVRGVTEAGNLAGIAALVSDSRGLDNVAFTGDEPSDIDSDFEPWRVGYQRSLAQGLVYDLRRYAPAPINQPFIVTPPAGYEFILFDLDALNRPRFRVGIDEDPPGDLSSLIIGDPPAAGLAGVDDDMDGLTDEDSQGLQPGETGFSNDLADDDDEDGLVDEDAPDTYYDSFALPYELRIDRDDDGTGIFDEGGKVNINYAGNLWSQNGGQGISSGFSRSEVDLSLLIYAVMRQAGWTTGRAEQLAREIILYRHGAGRPGASVNIQAGMGGVDDDGNGDPNLRPPNNTLDDNQNRLIDDVEEFYIGPTFVNRSGNRISDYYPGDRIDNDGDGLTDEDFADDVWGLREGTDEPGEFRVELPFGDDNPFNTIDEARFVPGMLDTVTLNDGQDNNNDGQTDEVGEDEFTVFQLLEPFITVYSSAQDKSPHYGDELFRLRINTLNNYTPPMVNPDDVHRRRSPEDLFGLGFDDDTDWIQFDVKDPATQQVIVPSDDINKNGHPDGNWDREADNPFAIISGIDSDRDGWVRNGTEGDNGDHDNDNNIASDPEPHVNEDDIGNAYIVLNNGSWAPGIKDGVGINGDDDGDSTGAANDKADYDDDQVNYAMDAARRVLTPGFPNPDPIADPENGRDGIDNDGDGVIDEIGETYIAVFDDDEDGAYDEDPSEAGFMLRVFDWLDQIGPENDTLGSTWFTDPVMRRRLPLQVRRYPARTYNPNDINKFNQDLGSNALFNVNDPTDPNADDDQTYIFQEGCEAIRINEVMLEPFIRLEAEDFDDFQLISGVPDNASQASGCNGVNDTSWRLDSSGNFFVVHEDGQLCSSGVRNPPNQPERATFTFRDLPPGAILDLVLHADTSGSGQNINMAGVAGSYTVTLTANGIAADIANSASAEWSNLTIPNTGQIVIDFQVFANFGTPALRATFDHLDLFADEAQYVELINVSSKDPVDLTNWELRTEIGPDRKQFRIATTARPFILEPGQYAIITADESATKKIFTSIYGNQANILAATFAISSASVDFFKGKTPGGRDFLIELRDGAGNYMDSAEAHIEYATAQQGFEAFERADPTASDYEFKDMFNSGFPDSVVTTHPWGELKFKDARIPETPANRTAFNGRGGDSDKGWVWNPDMQPGDPDFMMYVSQTGDDPANPVQWEWPLVRIKQNREFRIRATGQTGMPVGLVESVAGIQINQTTPTVAMSGGYVMDDEEVAVVDPSTDTTLSLELSADNSLANGPFAIKSISLVTHQTRQNQPSPYPSGKYLTGSPGEDNAGFYPLRSILEAPLVKNGRLATPGELTQVTTGGEFVRDASRSAVRAAYLADYISTEPANTAEREGLININTAPRPVLMALPWSEPDINMNTRVQVADLCSWVVWQWAHNPVGPDGQPGVAGVDDNRDGKTDMVGSVFDSGELNAVGSDDGPFDDAGEILTCLNKSRLPDGRPVMTALQQIQPGITAERIYARISNVTTVRSSVFSVISRGRVVDVANRGDNQARILSQKRVKSVAYREQF